MGVRGGVASDAEEPRCEWRPGRAIAREVVVRAGEDALREVRGLVAGTAAAEHIAVDAREVALVQQPEILGALQGSRYKLSVLSAFRRDGRYHGLDHPLLLVCAVRLDRDHRLIRR